MSDKIYQPPKTLKNPHIENVDEYAAMYKESIENPETFFGNAALQNLSWSKPFTSVHNNEFAEAKWFEGGKLNIAFNCIDRHLEKYADKTALIWEGDDPGQSQDISYF